MKKKWIAACGFSAFFLSAGIALWMEKPALTQMASNMITTTANSKLNGTLGFSSLDISLTGQVVLAKPVIKDSQGRIVFEGEDVRIYVNPGKIVTALKQGEILQALDTADVNEPVLHLWQNRDGSWNITSILKPTESSSDSGFRGVIRVHDGTVRALLPDNTLVVGNDVMASVSFAKYPSMDIDADMNVDGQKITAHGRYASSRQYDFVVNADAVDARYASFLIPASNDVVLQNGTVKNAKVRVADSHKGFFMSGQADFADGKLDVSGVAIDELKGHADLTTNDVTLSGVEGLANGQAFRIDGKVVTNGDVPVFNLNVDVPGADVTAFAGYIPEGTSGTADFKGIVWGSTEDVRVKGTAGIHNFAYNGYTVDEASADVNYSGQMVTVDSLTARAFGAYIKGKAQYDVNTGAYAAEADVRGLDLTAVPDMPVGVMGLVSGSFRAGGNSKDGSILATGTVQASNLSYNGLAADRAQADVTYDGHVVNVNQGHADVGGGSLDISGSYDVDQQRPQFSFTAHDIPLDMASPLLSVPMSGTADAAGHIDGQNWDLAFSAKDGQIKGMLFDSINGSAHGQGKQIEIPALYWRRGEGLHTLTGRADLDSRTVDASLTTSHIRVEQLLPLVGKEDLPLTGWADNTVTIKGTLDNPSAAGSFRLTSGSYAGYLYKNISADYRLNQGTVYLSNGDISSYTASVALEGSIGDTLDLDVTGKNIDVSRLAPQNQTPRSGSFDLTAHIGGTMSAPTASGALKADNLVINHMVLNDVHGDFAYYDSILRLTNLHFSQLDGNYDANLMYNTKTSFIRGQATVVNGDIAGLIKVADMPVQDITGKLNGQIDISGTSDNPTVSMKGNISQGTFGGETIDPSDVDVRLEQGIVNINKLALKIGDGTLAAKGSYALHGPVALSVAAKQFPSKALMTVLGKTDFVVDAPIDFAADLSGTSDDLQADVSAQLGSGTANGISISGAFALFNIRRGMITVQQASASRDPYKISAKGTIPVSALSGGKTDESMDVDFQLSNTSLDILTFLTPYVTDADGQIQGAVKVSGTLADPQVTGDVTVKDGTIKFKDTVYPLNDINADLSFKGRSAVLSGSGTMDKKGKKDPGSVSISGNASWSGRSLDTYSLSADFANLNVDNPYYNGPLTGYINVTPGDGRPKIGGLIDINNATIDVPLTLSESSSTPDLDLDFTLSLGDKVRLYNSALYDLMVTGAVSFKGSLEHPNPSGRFEATRGSVHYLDTNFRVSKAIADFSRYDSLLPYIDAEGISRVGQYTVMLTLRGQADNMDLLLRSDPPLTKPQIVSLITLRNGSGRPQSSIGEDDMSSLLGSGIRMMLNSLGITQSLEKALSLDMLTVTNGSLDLNDRNTDVGNNYYNIEMGKYLFNDFMVTAAFGLNHDDNRFGIMYDLGSRFSLSAWTSSDNNFIGALYKYNF